MKQSNLVWLGIPVAVLALCLFLRSEMERNRKTLRRDVREEIAAASTSAIEAGMDVIRRAPQDATHPLPSNTNRVSGTNLDTGALARTLLEVAAQTVQKVDRIALDATRLSDADETAIGAEMDIAMLKEFKAVPNSPHASRIDRLIKPILDQRQRTGIDYTFRIVESQVVNAFSIAGGYVYITTAFLREFPADASLVMALSHEVAHVDLRHCVEKVQYARRARTTLGPLADIGQVIYSTFSTPYTKGQEFAADEYGYLACRKAGWAAPDLLKLLHDLGALERRAASAAGSPRPSALESRIEEFLKSHPPTDERLRRLENLHPQ